MILESLPRVVRMKFFACQNKISLLNGKFPLYEGLVFLLAGLLQCYFLLIISYSFHLLFYIIEFPFAAMVIVLAVINYILLCMILTFELFPHF